MDCIPDYITFADNDFKIAYFRIQRNANLRFHFNNLKYQFKKKKRFIV